MLFDGATGKVIKDSGKTLGVSVPADAVFTDTTYSDATQSEHGLMSVADKTKLDGIDTGANKTTVEDILTSTSATNALSANQGRVLNEMIVPTEYTGDLDNAGTGRWYCGALVANIPSATAYIVDSLVYSSSHAIQIAYRRSGDYVFVRRKNNGTWSDWFELADADRTYMERTPVSITSDTDIIDWLPGMYSINDQAAADAGYIPIRYGNLTVAPPSGTYGYCIFTALNSGTVFWRAFHKTNKTWYTAWQPLNADDLGSFASLSAFETALDTYGGAMKAGFRQIIVAFSAASSPFANLTYVGFITRTASSRYQVKLNVSGTNRVITGTRGSSSWTWDELALKSNIPGVINNLTNTSTTDALSANQGKVLNDTRQYKTYDSVTDIGLTSGSATFVGAWDALSAPAMLITVSDDFTSSERGDMGTGCTIMIVKRNNSRGIILSFRKEDDRQWRMPLDNSTNKPSGTWVLQPRMLSKTLSRPTTDANGCINTGIYASDSDIPVCVSGYIANEYTISVAGKFSDEQWIIQVRNLTTGAIVPNTRIGDVVIDYIRK